MKFNLEAAKAYIGALLATAAETASSGNGIGGVVVKFIEALLAFDIPPQFETWIAAGVAWVVGYIAVYMTPNKKPSLV